MRKDYDLKQWLGLTLVRRGDNGGQLLGPSAMRRALDFFESPGAVLRAREGELRKVFPVETAARIAQGADPAEVERALKWAAEEGNAIVTLGDAGYPPQLLEIADPPALLYVRGEAAILRGRMIAMVGSRSASHAGARNTEIFARALSDAGLPVASGLALGIDSAAHRGAMAGRSGTAAILATGADVSYPKENRELAAEIAARGALATEYPLGTKALTFHFPHRNRIISGLSEAVLVVEATRRSGSLTTARLALEQGRDVFAVPGSINSPLHRGCHALIKQGAKLAENVDDILEELNVLVAPPSFREAEEEEGEEGGNGAGDGEGNDDVLRHIDFEPTTVDNICARTGLGANELMPALLDLELAGKVVTVAGGKYQRLA